MPRPRSHGAGTKREAVLSAAAELLLSQGYDATSMDAVAARAGVSKTTVYAHFADKDKLFRAVMVQASSVLTPNITEVISAEVTDSVERLTLALTAVVRASIAPEPIAFFRVLISEHERRGQLAGVLDEARQEGGVPDVISILAPFIQAVAVERGAELVDPELWVMFLLRLAAPTLQFDMLISDFVPDDALVTAHVRAVVGIFVRGAFPQAGSVQLPAEYRGYPWGPAFDHD